MKMSLLESEKEWFIQAPWGKLCIVAWGNCLDPPILVCHGERDSLASFRPLLQLLPTNFYYVGMELPGNGRSDPYPPGLPVNLLDLVYCLEVVRRHFRWDQFIYLAHSIATTIGRLYNLSYPGRMSRVVELDQVTPTFVMVTPENFADWYNILYTQYFDKFDFYNSPKENGPKYTMEQAVERVMRVRQLSPEAARATVERWCEPAGHGLVRFTIDQRTKHFLRPPFSAEQVKALFTSLPTPTLGIIAENSIKNGYFVNTGFFLEEYGNYRVKKVKGGHDVHITNPERMAPFVSQFLLHGIEGLDRKAKL